MDLQLTADQEMMRDSARRLVERHISPQLEKNDPNKPLPKSAYLAIFKELADLGLTAARLPADAGGPGITMLDYGIMFEQIPPAIGLALVAHEATTSRLYADCNDEQRARLIPDLIAGRKIGCTGSTEPETGSDPRGIKTRLTQKGKSLILNGRKMWISNVSQGDIVFVTCLDHRESNSSSKVIKVIVERDRSPYEAHEIDTIGLRQGMLGEVVFDDCEIPSENLIEAEGGTAVLKTSWAINRPLFGLLAVNMAQRAYDIALDYAKVRKQFGKPIAAHQLIQKNLSDIVTAITSSRLMCYHALSLADQGAPTDGAAAMAKRYAQNACREAVWQAMNVLGAMGLSTEMKVEALYRDIRMVPVPDGTNEILALIHGRELTGLEAFRGISRAAQ